MCNLSNSNWRARKARLGNLRSEGCEMGLTKGCGFSAKRSAGHFRVCSVPSAGNRPFQKSVILPWKVGSLCRKKISQEICMACEKFTRNLLLVVLLSVLRMFWVNNSMLLWKICFDNIAEICWLLEMLVKAESSTAGYISDRACEATATGTQIKDTNCIKMGTTTPCNGKCTIVLLWTIRVGQTWKTRYWTGCAAAMVDGKGKGKGPASQHQQQMWESRRLQWTHNQQCPTPKQLKYWMKPPKSQPKVQVKTYAKAVATSPSWGGR